MHPITTGPGAAVTWVDDRADFWFSVRVFVVLVVVGMLTAGAIVAWLARVRVEARSFGIRPQLPASSRVPPPPPPRPAERG